MLIPPNKINNINNLSRTNNLNNIKYKLDNLI